MGGWAAGGWTWKGTGQGQGHRKPDNFALWYLWAGRIFPQPKHSYPGWGIFTPTSSAHLTANSLSLLAAQNHLIRNNEIMSLLFGEAEEEEVKWKSPCGNHDIAISSNVPSHG